MYRLAYEDFNPRAPGGAASRARQEARSREGQEAVLFDLYNFFDVRMADRLCLIEHCASPALADLEIELGLSTVGGRSDISTSAGCEDVGQILPVEGIDLATWSDALGELEITVSPPGPVDRDLLRRYEDLGVDRVVVLALRRTAEKTLEVVRKTASETGLSG